MMSVLVTAFERDGLQFVVAVPADAPPLTSASFSAHAAPKYGGAEIDAASVTLDDGQIAVDFGAGALFAGDWIVQVVVTLGGRDRTIWAGAATVYESLGD